MNFIKNQIGLNILKLSVLSVLFLALSCKQSLSSREKELVEAPALLNDRIPANIKAVLMYAHDHAGKIQDQVWLRRTSLLTSFYENREFRNFWSDNGRQLPYAIGFLNFLNTCEYYALYPKQYHAPLLDTLVRKFKADSLFSLDAMSWTKFDLLLSDAFISVLKDLKDGRMLADSISVLNNADFFFKKFDRLSAGEEVNEIMSSVQPTESRYLKLQQAARSFVDTMDRKKYLRLRYPYKDSLDFVKNVYKRLLEDGYGSSEITLPDSLEYRRVVTKYQKDRSLTVDGIAGGEVVRSLNNTDAEKFLRYAITSDKYKLLGKYPPEYILVNIPSFQLQVVEADSTVLESKVIVGKASTGTPEIISAISNMITYPQWVVPASIIRNEILPQLKKDPGYLYKKGFNLVGKDGTVADPYTVDWSKYSKWIPWRVVQGSGDGNALGVFKFNFNNKYSVYLHDTNQPYLFKRSNRALSHGCVRVQNWRGLAAYIARRDSLLLKEGQLPGYNMDSINVWINDQSRKTILVKNKVPLYIQYFTCEEKDGKIKFYDDIYGIDKELADRYY